MRGWFAWLFALSLSAATEASAQRLDSQVYRDWADAANGQPCETQIDGYYSSTAAGATEVVYPPEAFASRTTGEALLTFDTSYADGVLSIVNARVFASDPAGVFDEAALAVAQNFHFPTTMRNCQGLRASVWFRVNNANPERAMRGVINASYAAPPLRADTAQAIREGRMRERCQIEGGPTNGAALGQALWRLYPERAQQREREGLAVVRYSITPDGTVVDPVALEEFPAGWDFGIAATQAIVVMRFPPRAEACTNVVTTVRFALPD